MGVSVFLFWVLVQPDCCDEGQERVALENGGEAGRGMTCLVCRNSVTSC